MNACMHAYTHTHACIHTHTHTPVHMDRHAHSMHQSGSRVTASGARVSRRRTPLFVSLPHIALRGQLPARHARYADAMHAHTCMHCMHMHAHAIHAQTYRLDRRQGHGRLVKRCLRCRSVRPLSSCAQPLHCGRRAPGCPALCAHLFMWACMRDYVCVYVYAYVCMFVSMHI